MRVVPLRVSHACRSHLVRHNHSKEKHQEKNGQERERDQSPRRGTREWWLAKRLIIERKFVCIASDCVFLRSGRDTTLQFFSRPDRPSAFFLRAFNRDWAEEGQ